MAIVKLKKMTLCGLLKEKAAVLEKLQQIGAAHLIPLSEVALSPDFSSQDNTEKVVNALKYLNKCAKKRHQVDSRDDFDLLKVADQVLNVQEEIRRLSDQRDFLIKRIAEVEPWGDFEVSEDLAGIKLWFYIVPKRLMSQLSEDLVFQVVHQDNLRCYVVVLSACEPPGSSVPVPRTHTGKIPLSQLKNNLEQVELGLEDMQAERESLTRWISLMSLSLFDNQDRVDLAAAGMMTLDKHDIFVLQAWIPEPDMARFQQFVEQSKLAMLLADPEAGEKPPTLLANVEPLSGGEDVIGFYQTPGYSDWDPSLIVFFSFAVFFAMILSDAGYAAVLGLMLALNWNKLKTTQKKRRLRMLAFITVLFSLCWGVLSGGYFGYSPEQGMLAARLKLFDLNDFDNMMKLSIAVGAGHIIVANLIKAYQLKQRTIAWASIGWAMTVIGGFSLWLTSQSANQFWLQFSWTVFALGLTFLLFFSSERKLTKPVDYLWRLLEGIKSLTGLTRLFGDILSYMRLFALGLASASLALTFNQLALQVYHSESGLGLLFSILILLLGHSLNLLLCLMSGVVHGLRLNFIEFYNWSVSDEGYPFKTFSKKGGG